MKKATHDLSNELMNAIKPVLEKETNYVTILDSMCLVLAKIIHATPAKGTERDLTNASHEMVKVAVKGLMEADLELSKGIASFAEFAKQDEAQETQN
jgi:hypothetical protein